MGEAGADIIAELRGVGLIGEGDVALEPLTGGVSCDVWKVETPTRSKSFLLSSSLSLLLMLTAAALVKVTIHGLALRSAFNRSTIAAMQVVDLPDPGSATARLFPLRVMTALAICICSADNI